MDKLHITQDDAGYWMMSLEREDGTLTLLEDQFETPEHLIDNANEMIERGIVRAVVVLDPPRSDVQKPHASEGYRKPAPRKAGS
jgi:hypothetical protein